MLDIAKSNDVLTLSLNRPDRRNALCTEGMGLLRSALSDADKDSSIRVIVLTGVAPAFCAGSDLKELGGLDIAGLCTHEAETASVARGIAHLTKPVIAAVEGYALGGGFILAVSCDLVVTAANARWHLPEVLNGWIPPWGLGALLARVGPVKARALTWGAEPIDGNDAHRLGVADALAAPGEALATALVLASKLAKLPPEAVKSVKQFYEPFAASEDERLDDVASRLFAQDCESAAAKSTLARFTVKA